ncbi:MAG: hypothetical protein IPQ07_23550 [Myxococcales bacterium]|nr:hypothetical protein [Myxococcales bacterium]
MESLTVDFATGKPSASGRVLSSNQFVAGVLTACGVTAVDHLGPTEVFDASVARLLVLGALCAGCGNDTMMGGDDPPEPPPPDVCETSVPRLPELRAAVRARPVPRLPQRELLAEGQRQSALGVDFDTIADVQRWKERITIRAAGTTPTMPPAGGPSEQERAWPTGGTPLQAPRRARSAARANNRALTLRLTFEVVVVVDVDGDGGVDLGVPPLTFGNAIYVPACTVPPGPPSLLTSVGSRSWSVLARCGAPRPRRCRPRRPRQPQRQRGVAIGAGGFDAGSPDPRDP